MTHTLDTTGRKAVEDILAAAYSYAPEGLVDEIDGLFGQPEPTPFDQPLFIQVRDSIWMTFPSKNIADEATRQIFGALDRTGEVVKG